MNIPKSVKIGGKVYCVEFTRSFNFGSLNVSAEIDYEELAIRIAPNAKDKVEGDFIHELIHAIADHLGYKNHNEKKIDEFANALHRVIRDNHELFIN